MNTSLSPHVLGSPSVLRLLRTLAGDLLGKPGGAAGAFAAVQQLSSLPPDSVLAVLAAVAAGCCELSESDSKHAKVGREAKQRVPGPEMLTHWRAGGCVRGTFTWSVPRFSKLRASGQSPVNSPVFAAEGRRWQLQLFPRGRGGGPPSLDLYLHSWDVACSSARRNDSFATDFNLGLLNQVGGWVGLGWASLADAAGPDPAWYPLVQPLRCPSLARRACLLCRILGSGV